MESCVRVLSNSSHPGNAFCSNTCRRVPQTLESHFSVSLAMSFQALSCLFAVANLFPQARPVAQREFESGAFPAFLDSVDVPVSASIRRQLLHLRSENLPTQRLWSCFVFPDAVLPLNSTSRDEQCCCLHRFYKLLNAFAGVIRMWVYFIGTSTSDTILFLAFPVIFHT